MGNERVTGIRFEVERRWYITAATASVAAIQLLLLYFHFKLFLWEGCVGSIGVKTPSYFLPVIDTDSNVISPVTSKKDAW